MSEPTIYFFGCLKGAYGHSEAGHFLYTQVDGRPKSLSWAAYDKIPWGKKIDSWLAPATSFGHYGRELPQGKALLHQKDGWTVISFWDRTGDRRGKSNSAFLVHADMSFDELLKRARSAWPDLFERFDFEIEQVEAYCRLEGDDG